MSIQVLFLVLAATCFALSAWSNWWSTPQPYYPRLMAAGLFFWVMATLWPMIGK